jgi:hypothetical protein
MNYRKCTIILGQQLTFQCTHHKLPTQCWLNKHAVSWIGAQKLIARNGHHTRKNESLSMIWKFQLLVQILGAPSPEQDDEAYMWQSLMTKIYTRCVGTIFKLTLSSNSLLFQCELTMHTRKMTFQNWQINSFFLQQQPMNESQLLIIIGLNPWKGKGPWCP